VKWAIRCTLLSGILVVLVGTYEWATRPRTPEALFKTRCAACHELRTDRLCEFPPALRPAIVDTMRHLHEADRVIDDAEAAVIRRYLEESLPCP
jgi:mono/diheme cytochrome c family protein